MRATEPLRIENDYFSKLAEQAKILRKAGRFEPSELNLDELAKTPRETAAAMASSLKLFIRVMYYAVNHIEFRFEKDHNIIITALESYALNTNQKKNLAICLPPRFGKSTIVIYFLAWCYAVIDKRCNFIATSYAESLTEKFSGEVMDIIKNKYFQKFFGITMSKDTSAKAQWKIKDGGLFRAPPIEGTIVGFGAGRRGVDHFGGAIILDDILNPKFQESIPEKDKNKRLYNTAIKTRRNNLAFTPIIAIMQRVAQDDLIGYIKENEADDWQFIEVSAIIEDENGNEVSFWEEQYPIEELKKMRRQDPFGFAANYMQAPIPLGGEMIKEEWFKFYNAQFNNYYLEVFMTADTSFKANEANDPTALMVWGLTMERQLHLLDMVHRKILAVDLRRIVLNLFAKWQNNQRTMGRPITKVWIEDRASGMQLIQELQQKDRLPVRAYPPNSNKRIKMLDKMQKINDAVPQIENGNILLPNNAGDPISQEVILEAVQIQRNGKHKHDDIMDAIAMAVEVTYGKSRGFF